jgi:hypothetical protein
LLVVSLRRMLGLGAVIVLLLLFRLILHFLQQRLRPLFHPLMLLLTLQLIQIIIIILYPKNFLLNYLNLILRFQPILILIKRRYEIFIYYWVQLNRVDMRQFALVNRLLAGDELFELAHSLVEVGLG